jgi:hypothetical protein
LFLLFSILRRRLGCSHAQAIRCEDRRLTWIGLRAALALRQSVVGRCSGTRRRNGGCGIVSCTLEVVATWMARSSNAMRTVVLHFAEAAAAELAALLADRVHACSQTQCDPRFPCT